MSFERDVIRWLVWHLVIHVLLLKPLLFHRATRIAYMNESLYVGRG